MVREWRNVELPREEAKDFRLYLRSNNITYEPSEAFDMIHFQCYMTDEEALQANEWIKNRI